MSFQSGRNRTLHYITVDRKKYSDNWDKIFNKGKKDDRGNEDGKGRSSEHKDSDKGGDKELPKDCQSDSDKFSGSKPPNCS